MILQGVAKGIGFDRVRLYLLDEEKRQLFCTVAVGVEREKIQNLTLPYDREDNMVSRAIMEAPAFHRGRCQPGPARQPGLDQFSGCEILCRRPSPLPGEGPGGDRRGQFDQPDADYREKSCKSLMIFANQAALALENALMYEELKTFSSQLEDRVRKASARLEETQRQLFQSEKLAALGKLSAGIAHEIRNPLTSIKILIHSLADEMATEASREKDLAVIEAAIGRVNNIIKQFLDFARPRPPSLEPMDVRAVLEETLALLVYEMDAQRVSLERNYGPDLPPVPMDREQMKQVFLNLLLNAIQAMEGGGSVRIHTRLKPQGADGKSRFAEIAIRDTGPGMPPEISGTKFLSPSFPRRKRASGWACRSRSGSSKSTAGRSGSKAAREKGRPFTVTPPGRTEGEITEASNPKHQTANKLQFPRIQIRVFRNWGFDL